MDYSLLEPDYDYISLSESAYDCSQNLLCLLGEEITEWSDLKDEDKYFYVKLTRYILNNFEHVEPIHLHKMWLKHYKSTGWKHSELTRVKSKYHKYLKNWSNLTVSQKMKDKIYLATVLGLKDLFMEV